MDRYLHLPYRLTAKVKFHGCGCKLPKLELESLLGASAVDVTSDPRVLAGVGDDAGVVRVTDGVALVQHLDFFTPIIDDPYIQGRIGACNAASDVFSKGATDLVGALMIIGIPEDMPDEVLGRIVDGFRDLCSDIDAPIVGGQTIYSGWPVVGGAVAGLAPLKDVVLNSRARPGDVLVLTKPLGTQPAMKIVRSSRRVQRAKAKGLRGDVVSGAIDLAVEMMCTPNREAARAMLEVGVNACTDITGFGVLGHTATMAKRSGVDIEIHTLPVIEGTVELAKAFGHRLLEGLSPETSGGLMMSVSGERVDTLVSALERRGVPAYRVGVVRRGRGEACMAKQVKVLQVSKS